MRDLTPMAADWAVKIVGAIILVFVAYIVAGWVRSITKKAMEKARLDETLVRFISNGARWMTLLVSFIAVLGIFGIQTASFAAVLGAMGVAIGLAFQGTLGNLASGVMLLAFRPFKIGDVIDVAGQTGKVDEIDLMTTALNTPDNKRIIIPNGMVFSSVITNFSAESLRRVDVKVGVDYSADLEKTREVLMSVTKDIELQLEGHDPVVVCTDLGDSSVNWQVRFYVHPDDFFTVLEAGTVAVKKALDEAGIGIPFPQMDVHLDGGLDKAA
jgi:small conductance mechanosensitive channel